MLVIKIELWPKGNYKAARSLGVATISNIGGDNATGDYECRLFKSAAYSSQAEKRPLEEMCTRPLARETWRVGTLKGFPRLDLGPWDLLFRALGLLVGMRNPMVASFEPGETP